jgi:integrase/plastocyanin
VKTGRRHKLITPQERQFENFGRLFFTRYRHNWKPVTLAGSQRVFNDYLVSWFTGHAVDHISSGDVQRWFAALHDKPGAANRSLALLSVMMREAERYGYRDANTNPCKGMRRYRLRKQERFLSDDEYRHLGRMLAAQDSVTPLRVAMIRLLLLTGCRKSEIRTLKWSYYRTGRNGRKHLYLPDSKTGPKTIYLSAPARAILDSLPRTSAWVFPTTIKRKRGRPRKDAVPFFDIDFWNVFRSRAGLADGTMDPARASVIKAELAGAIIVVDEASLASAVDMRDLLQITDKLDLQRLVLVGDTRQLNGVGAGAPFRLMQQAGMETASMRDIVRQRDPMLKDAVMAASLGRGAAALEMLKESVIETDKQSLSLTAAEQWLELGDDERASTLLVAPMRHQRDEINEHIREALVDDGTIGGNVMEITRLDSYRMTRAQKQDPANYQAGDKIVFAVDSNRASLKANEIYTVIDHDERFVALVDGDGGERRFDPGGGAVTRRDIASRLDVYEPVEMSLQAGDHIRWTRNDNARGLINAQQAEVTDITSEQGIQSVHMRTNDGRNLSLDQDDPQLGHCDYALIKPMLCRPASSFLAVGRVMTDDIIMSYVGHSTYETHMSLVSMIGFALAVMHA